MRPWTAPRCRRPCIGRWLSAAETFNAATIGGAKALGLDDLGAREVGKKADLVGYSLDAPSLTPLNDPITQVVYGERGAGGELVLVEGNIVVEDGRCAGIDEVALLREAQDAHAELKEQISRSLADSGPFLEALSKVYFKTLQCPLCHDHLPAWV
ncbi:MAG: amidohydrolase family protein, partial [Chloroflexi bacterium]|nr:amidohydrolase family protein [Chloroflexota bacterium]